MEQGNYLIISSYPLKLAWLCLFIIFGSLYVGISQMINHYVILVGVTVPTVFLFIFDFKLTIFDFNNKEMLQTNYSIRGKSSLTLPFSAILQIDTSTNKYFGMIGGCVSVLTPHHQYLLTTFSDASTVEKDLLIKKLRALLAH